MDETITNLLNYKELEVKENKEQNGIEVYFTSYPGKDVISTLKKNCFRWSNFKKCWYIKADMLGNKKEATETKKETVNKYGVKVGDLFACSWGYDQTNYNFYQVTEINGSEFVTVRPIAENYIGHSCQDDIIKPARDQFLENDVLINGDKKRCKVKLSYYSKCPQIVLQSGYYWASLIKDENETFRQTDAYSGH